MRCVLITGAAGNIGRVLRRSLRGAYPTVRLSDIADLGEADAGEELWPADLRNLAQVKAAARGADAIIHLGAVSKEADWEAIHETNIVGTYNILEAARQYNVARVVLASSNHVTGFHRCTRRIGPLDPIRPDSRYGVSKAFGEALGRMYADKYGVSCVCLRIGTFAERPGGGRALSTWISPRDMVQLTRCSLDAPDVHFEIVYGVSANHRSWWDNPGADRLGYKPVDDAEQYAAVALQTAAPSDMSDVERLFQGTPYCAIEFSGDVSAID